MNYLNKHTSARAALKKINIINKDDIYIHNKYLKDTYKLIGT